MNQNILTIFDEIFCLNSIILCHTVYTVILQNTVIQITVIIQNIFFLTRRYRAPQK